MLLVYVVVALLFSIIFLAYKVSRKFPAVGSKLLFIQTLLVLFWFLMDTFVLFGYKPDLILQMHSLKFLSIVATPVVFLFMTIAYTNNDFLLKKINKLVFFIIPAITLIMIATNNQFGLFWSNTEVIKVGSNFGVIPHKAIMFWVHATYSYSLIFFSLVLLFNKFIKSPPIYRKQSGFLLFGCSIAWLLNILFVWSFHENYLYDPTPLSSLMILYVFYWGLYTYGS